MSRVTILRTNKGTKILGTTQCSTGAYWDAEGCYRYCNLLGTNLKGSYPSMEEHQASKLLMFASDLGNDCVNEEKWWKNRENFVDIEIGYEVDQTYKG